MPNRRVSISQIYSAFAAMEIALVNWDHGDRFQGELEDMMRRLMVLRHRARLADRRLSQSMTDRK
jgi:hypothetical protein